MRFSQMRLENWRNFGQVDVALQNRAFLVGPNASGKSNFLDAFRFLRDLVVPGGGFEQAVISRGGVSRIRNLAARRQPNVSIEASLIDAGDDEEHTWRYHISFAQDRQRRPILKREAVWHNGNLLFERPNEDDENDPERLRQTQLEQTFANLAFREIADFFAQVSYFHLVPQLIRDPDRWLGEKNDPFGGDFLERMDQTNQRVQRSRLRRIEEALRVAVPQLRELTVDKDERGIPHLKGNYEHWRPHGAWQTEADFSDGTLRLVGLLWSLLDGSGTVLLEEPELSLHPAIVQRIPQMMWRIQQSRGARQVLLSTHSKELLSDEGIAADEILLFIPSDEGSTIQTGVSVREVRVQLEAGLPPGEVVIPHTQPAAADQLSLWGV